MRKVHEGAAPKRVSCQRCVDKCGIEMTLYKRGWDSHKGGAPDLARKGVWGHKCPMQTKEKEGGPIAMEGMPW